MLKWAALAAGIVAALYAGIYFLVQYSIDKPWQTHAYSVFAFDLPPQWQCEMEGTEFVCQPHYNDRKPDALTVAAAKVVGPNDNFTDYETYLRTARVIPPQPGDDKPNPPSTVLEFEYRNIDGKRWLFAAHHGALLPNYISHYYVTLEGGVAVLMTMSFHESREDFYRPIVEQSVRSLVLTLS